MTGSGRGAGRLVSAAIGVALIVPSSASAADPVDTLRGSLTLGTAKRPGPVVAFSVRTGLVGTVKVTDRRRGVRFAGKVAAKSVRAVGATQVVGTAVQKVGKRRYVLAFTLTDRGAHGDRVKGTIKGPRGKRSRKLGRGYSFAGKARKGNVKVGRKRAGGPMGPGPIVVPPIDDGTSTGPGGSTDPGGSTNPPAPPPVDRTVATTAFDASKFLYTGAGAPQTGVAAGTIRPQHVAVLNGEVHTVSGAPLGGVGVKVLGRPEFGQTVTAENGRYALAVNGGEQLTLDFDKGGYLPLQRAVSPGWQSWEAIEPVVLTARQASATPVSFGADGDANDTIARGDTETDGDGTRRGTLILPDDVTAQMKMADGSTAPLSAGDVRIKEATVGATGPEAMPAALPPGSAYTYAVSLSIDQADSAGAMDVEFSEPLPYYTDNFLGFPVGTRVPLGYYDERRGTWVGSDSGRVVKIVSETDGQAHVDTDGDGTADDAGIDEAERKTLATLYDSPKELWRVELPHFSWWDLNWGARPPAGSQPPKNLPLPDWMACPGCGSGGGPGPIKNFGTIDPETQVLDEDVPLAGIDFGLHYSSRRSVGYGLARTVEVQVDDPLPGPVSKVEIQVSVAGRLLTKTLYKPGTAPAGQDEFTPGQIVRVVWDGRDAFGRTLVGGQTAKVRVGHTYQAAYGATTAFDWPPGTTLSGSRSDTTLWSTRLQTIGGVEPAAAALGGWSPTNLHSYDPVGGVLYEGGGQVRSTAGAAPTIETLAVTNGVLDGIKSEPDGGLVWYDQNNGTLNRRTPDGTVAILRQAGQPWLRGGDVNGEDKPVEQVHSDTASFDRAGDGSFLYTDAGCRVRRIYKDGAGTWRVRTVAGRPPDDCDYRHLPQGDGGPAVGASLAFANGVAAMPDGGFVFGDGRDSIRIRRVYPDGRIQTLAVLDQPGTVNYGAPIPRSISVDREGRVVWRSSCNIGRIDTDGSQTLLAGVGTESGTTAEGALGKDTRACVPVPWGAVETGPDGAVYYDYGGQIRRIATD
ncbi:MAG: hypothetical protein QOJ57_1019, partial [Thermoleophilaceae bacterium]|nr:hypothetical protein [Thermoleophilaceae bacterium]